MFVVVCSSQYSVLRTCVNSRDAGGDEAGYCVEH